MEEPRINVLILCTGNSCRSIMAEALFNELGSPVFEAFSAGSKPAGFVHPQALACLNRNRIPVAHPNSKSWDEFADTHIDLVITVCGNAANETCPVFPGPGLKAHWGLPDPADASGSDAEVAAVFQTVFEALHRHIKAFINAYGSATGTRRTRLESALREVGAPEISATLSERP